MKKFITLLILLFAMPCWADQYLENLTVATTPATTDILYLVINPSTSPADRYMTLANLIGGDWSTIDFRVKSITLAKTTSTANKICLNDDYSTEAFGDCWQGSHQTGALGANRIYQFPTAAPASSIMLFPTPTGGTTTATWLTPGTGVATALANTLNATSGLVGYSGALGTPSGGTLTNCSGLPVAGITASTSTALGVGSIELGHASDTSITRVSGGVIAVEGLTIPRIIASGTIALATAAINSGACTTAQDGGTATGVATTDVIQWSPAADPTGVQGYAVSATGSLYIWAYPTTDHVNFKVCNNTAGQLTPAALTLNWKVTR